MSSYPPYGSADAAPMGGDEGQDMLAGTPSNDHRQLGGLDPPPSSYHQLLGGLDPTPSNEQQQLGVGRQAGGGMDRPSHHPTLTTTSTHSRPRVP